MAEFKKKIKIAGSKVTDVGYRLFLLEEAERRKITNLDMKNLKEKEKECVEILVGDNKDKVDEYISWIKLPSNKPENAEVDNILEEDYFGDIISREEYYKIFTASQLSKMATSGGKLLEIQKEISYSIKETTNLQKEISDSIKETVNLQKDIKTRISRFSNIGQNIIGTQDEIKDKIDEKI